MRPASKNSTASGIKQKNPNRFNSLRLYLISSSLVIFVAFAVLTQVLIQNAKREQEFVPRLFAQYIAYTDNYMRSSEKYAELLTEVFSRYIQISTHDFFAEDLWDYVSREFTQKNPLPVVITDQDTIPTLWNRVGVSQDSSYSSLSAESRLLIDKQMQNMERIPMVDRGQLSGYAYFR
ncbi:MAG TPA: hypothetical protein P5533_00185, partial [Candidatus Cloacimonadota bacterium]|nr:hypothetical protein [Candidatus Cloacimonadota bacterium]